jgi:quercetin dioxygenase-like cupin family protein
METSMSRRFVFSIALLSLLSIAGAPTPHAQSAGVKRTVLMRRATTVPGYEVVLLEADIPAGGREGRHTHPGTLLARVEQGTVTLDYEGKSTAYKAGESFFVDAGKVHEGSNKGDVPAKILATLVVKTGEALTTQEK